MRDLVYLLDDAEYVDQLEKAIVLLEKYLKELKSIEKTDGHHKSRLRTILNHDLLDDTKEIWGGAKGRFYNYRLGR